MKQYFMSLAFHSVMPATENYHFSRGADLQGSVLSNFVKRHNHNHMACAADVILSAPLERTHPCTVATVVSSGVPRLLGGAVEEYYLH